MPEPEQQKSGENTARAEILRRLEQSASNAYRALDEHDSKTLKQDVSGVVERVGSWYVPRLRAFRTWFRGLSPGLKLLYGLALAPVALLAALAIAVMSKSGVPLLLAGALVLKVLLKATKLVALIGYFGYKILKSILISYYSASRLLSGRKARRLRESCARKGFPVQPEGDATRVSYRCRWKRLEIEHREHGRIVVLFSYLRYAVAGQLGLIDHVRSAWRSFITPWRQDSRETIKTALQAVGASLFTPHTLGAEVTEERVLVPGDAELEQVLIATDGVACLRFRVRWLDWEVKKRAGGRLPAIKRHPGSAEWEVRVPFRRTA